MVRFLIQHSASIEYSLLLSKTLIKMLTEQYQNLNLLILLFQDFLAKHHQIAIALLILYTCHNNELFLQALCQVQTVLQHLFQL